MLLKSKEQFDYLVNVLKERTNKKYKLLDYFKKNEESIKILINLIENEEDKQFFNNLLYLYNKSFDNKLKKSIIKVCKTYYKLFIKQKSLTNKEIEIYQKHFKRLVKLLKIWKKEIKTLKQIKKDNIVKNYNVVNFFNNPDFKLNVIKRQTEDEKLEKTINKYKKIDKESIKQLKNVDKYKNKLLELLEKSKNI